MSMLQSRNPTLQAFENPQRWEDLDRAEAKIRQMTYGGTITVTGILVGLCAAAAVMSWDAMTPGGVIAEPVLSPRLALFGGMIGGLGVALAIIFFKRAAPFLAPVYAVLEGAFIAAFSLFIAERWLGGADDPEAMGVIFQAVVLTFGIAGGMLIAYSTGFIRGGPIFNKIVLTAGAGLCIYAVSLWLLNGLLGMGIPNLYASASPLGIGFTAVCVILASLFLILDFQMVEHGVKNGAPKYMEWYAGFGILVTLVWLYVEVLRLLAKLRSND